MVNIRVIINNHHVQKLNHHAQHALAVEKVTVKETQNVPQEDKYAMAAALQDTSSAAAARVTKTTAEYKTDQITSLTKNQSTWSLHATPVRKSTYHSPIC